MLITQVQLRLMGLSLVLQIFDLKGKHWPNLNFDLIMALKGKPPVFILWLPWMSVAHFMTFRLHAYSQSFFKVSIQCSMWDGTHQYWNIYILHFGVPLFVLADRAVIEPRRTKPAHISLGGDAPSHCLPTAVKRQRRRRMWSKRKLGYFQVIISCIWKFSENILVTLPLLMFKIPPQLLMSVIPTLGLLVPLPAFCKHSSLEILDSATSTTLVEDDYKWAACVFRG